MASPKAAESPWVRREIDWWIANRPIANMLILFTDGELTWDSTHKDFDWNRTTALPRQFSGIYKSEPLYVDLRRFRTVDQLSLRDSEFRNAILDIAPPLHGRDKDELDGEDVRQHRRFRIARNLALFTLAVLAYAAVRQQSQAEHNEITALVDSSENALSVNKQLEALMASVKAGKKVGDRLTGFLLEIFDADRWLITQAKTVATIHHTLRQIKEKNRLQRHSQRINDVVFSPICPNGKGLLASASRDGTINLWESDGKFLRTLNQGAEVVSISISADCHILAAASRNDGKVKLWSLDGTLLDTVSDDGAVSVVSFNDDGQLFATGNNNGRVTVWSEDGTKVERFDETHSARVVSVSFSPRCPDGRQLIASASAGINDPIRLWTLNDPSPHRFNAARGKITQLSFHPECRMVASASDDHKIRLWTLPDAKPYKTFTGLGPITSVKFSPDGKRLAAASETDRSNPYTDGNSVSLWNLNGNDTATTLRHGSPVTSISFSPDGKTLASGSADNSVRIWTIDGVEPDIALKGMGSVVNVSMAADGQTLAIVRTDEKVEILKVKTNQRKILDAKVHTKKIIVSPNGKSLVYLTPDNFLTVAPFNGSSSKQFDLSGKAINDIVFSPDSRTLALLTNDGHVELLNIETGEQSRFVADDRAVTNLSFSHDGNLIVTATIANTMTLWTLDGRKLKPLTGHEQQINSITFSPDDDLIASTSTDKTILIQRISANTVNTLRGHKTRVTNLTFHPNGKILASVDYDNIIKIWHVRGDEVTTIDPDSQSNIWAIRFSDNGKKLVTVNQDNTVKVRNVELEKLLDLGCKWLQDY
ncbi:MAG: WD40 repeat domain-containing protein, partial [Nitrososphaera sp.]